MMRPFFSMSLLFFLGIWLPSGWSQRPITHIHFSHLNTAQGLSDNYIYALELDRNGYLWLGTGDGLNRFSGQVVEKYFKADHPELGSNGIRGIHCDTSNRIWVLTSGGQVTLIDEQRKFHAVRLYREGKVEPVYGILSSSKFPVILVTRHHHLIPNTFHTAGIRDSLDMADFTVLPISGDSLLHARRYTQFLKLNDHEYAYAGIDTMYIMDFDLQAVTDRMACHRCRPLSTWSEEDILVYSVPETEVWAIHRKSSRITRPFEHVTDDKGKTINSYVHSALRLESGQLLISTAPGGLFLYTPESHSFQVYRHDAADNTTITNNTPSFMISDSTGWVFIGATPNGISYFNQHAVIGHQPILRSKDGITYDGFINHLASAGDQRMWVGTSTYLIEWSRKTNQTRFFSFPPENGDQINFVYTDRLDQTWVATHHSGVYILDAGGTVKQFIPQTPEIPGSALSSPTMCIRDGPDGLVWIGSYSGIGAYDPVTFEYHDVKNTPLAELAGKYIYRIEQLDNDHLWITSRQLGAWKYNPKTGAVDRLDKTSGFVSNECTVINEDHFGNLYYGTLSGLNIRLSDGRILLFDDQSGLMNNRVEALLLDRQNRMWIGNDVGLACFNIADTTIRVFDERYGLSVHGFRLNSYCQLDTDELVWGTERGIQYFFPDELYDQTIEIRGMINRIESRDVDSYVSGTETFKLRPGNNFITFHFASVDYSTHLHTFYQYKLEGVDDDWILATNQNSARYNHLAPGDYRFLVRTSNDKRTWVPAENEIVINLQAQLVQQFWFRLAAFLLLLGLVYAALSRSRKLQQAKTEALETEAVIHYFASQINRHQNIDDMLWDITKNCISKLRFEDCVIYTVDRQRQVLIQKAAYGPKSPDTRKLLQPIEISVGKGITGNVASTGQPEIVANTRKDERYIVDDASRKSEIAVPILVDGEVFGVIDSEHPEENFFNSKHLTILTTIAVLCANQIQRILAKEEKQKAEIEILQNKQKATESRLQSLRLQMNPHFLFNALNSIQQMILANEELVATQYLSRFSKLLRSVLIYSDKEMISLREELEILKLYIDLESVRFREAFSYEIRCDDDIDEDELKIPTLLIQPFVENAIWHGLMHKEGDRKLLVTFHDEGHFVRCIIEDNGIGRERSAELKNMPRTDKKHVSRGIAVSLERLQAMKKNNGEEGRIEIHDLIAADGTPAGTRVEILLPV